MMKDDEVKELELPLTDTRWNNYQNVSDEDMHGKGDTVEISFDPNQQIESARVNQQRVTNVKQIQIAYLTCFKMLIGI